MPVLDVRDVVKRFGTVTAVDGVSFAVGAGEVVGLLGPNGAGKTTTLHMVLGLVTPDAGARVDRLVAELDLEALRQRPLWVLSSGQQTRVQLAKALISTTPSCWSWTSPRPAWTPTWATGSESCCCGWPATAAGPC